MNALQYSNIVSKLSRLINKLDNFERRGGREFCNAYSYDRRDVQRWQDGAMGQ